MSFEEVLANCLQGLEQGRSIEDCLAQYPEHRAELAPILRMIDPMRHAPKPQLSARAFARGRAAVAAHARHQQKLRQPFIAATPRAVQTRPFYVPAPITPGVKAAQVKPLAAPLPPRPFLQMHRLMRAFVVLLMVLTFASFVRGVASSLPGSLLYPLKGWGENAQGLLMATSGQQASWHVNQLERRLTEFALLSQQGTAINPILTTAIDDHLQAALDSSTAMSADQRSQFLLAWLDRLHTLQQDLPGQTTTVATLKRAIATVETAAQRNNAPTILQVESTATPVPQFTLVATLPAGPVLLPTVTPTDTELPAPPVVLDTPPLIEEAPTPAATATSSAMFNPATPTATATELVIAVTVTQSPQLMPQEGNRAPEPVDAGEHESSKKATPTPTTLPEATVTATPVATLPAPRIPLPTGATTEEAGTLATAEPTEPANQTRVPGGIPTSAEPPTPAPTDTARNTPTATEKAATTTPTRAENKTSTPEPTATEKAATPTPTRPEATATPKPEETKRETPAPNTDSPTPTDDETAEPAEELDEPTPEPTPTPKKKKK